MALDDVLVVPLRAVETVKAVPFLLLGQERCGASAFQSAFANHTQAHCHGRLLHPQDRRRKREHESYFGRLGDDDLPDYCAQAQPDRARANPERYLDSRVFQGCLHGERAVGVRLTYGDLWYSGLWEYLEERVGSGVSVIHLTRNPLACLVSARQNAKPWADGDPPPRYNPCPVRVEVEEFVDFARRHAADEARVRRYCPDALVVRYADVVCRPAGELSRAFRMLELPPCPAARPSWRRLPNSSLSRRVSNFQSLKARVPQDLRAYFETDLF